MGIQLIMRISFLLLFCLENSLLLIHISYTCIYDTYISKLYHGDRDFVLILCASNNCFAQGGTCAPSL